MKNYVLFSVKHNYRVWNEGAFLFKREGAFQTYSKGDTQSKEGILVHVE